MGSLYGCPFFLLLFALGKYAVGEKNYSAFFSGSAGAGAGASWASPCPGAAGCSWIGPVGVSDIGLVADCVTGTDDITELCFPVKTARVSEVSIKRMAVIVVILFMNVAAPLLPNSVWLEPPKAAPISAPLLLWIRIIKISARQTIKWMTIIAVYIYLFIL
jgi:hypothetical protein